MARLVCAQGHLLPYSLRLTTQAGPRLIDLGYQIVPMLPSQYEAAAEVPMLL